jgi:CheY-like chemotaxis protein
MDIHMPIMDGYTAAGILKKNMGVTSPIVALTASDINDQIREEHADTIESFILKPFRAAAFYNAISPYFSRHEENLPTDGEEKKAGIASDAGPGVKQHGSEPEGAEECVEKERRNPFAGREDAIKNLGGLESIYFKHLEKFKVNYANTAEYIAELLDEKNFDEARRLAHSVKGLSGTLGMLDVMEASAELEKAILKGEDYDLTVELENFAEELKIVINAI